jgi:hypothetical protein
VEGALALVEGALALVEGALALVEGALALVVEAVDLALAQTTGRHPVVNEERKKPAPCNGMGANTVSD